MLFQWILSNLLKLRGTNKPKLKVHGITIISLLLYNHKNIVAN